MIVGKTIGHIDQSAFLQENFSIYDGPPPEVNLLNEKNNGLAVLKLIKDNLVLSAHDVSSGGILVSLAEMSIASGLGLKIYKPKKLTNSFEYFFGEDQGRYLIEVSKNNMKKIETFLKKNSTFFEIVAEVQNDTFEVERTFCLKIKDLHKIIISGIKIIMPLTKSEISNMIMEAFPDASLKLNDLAGDSNHYSAKIISKNF